MRKAVIFLAFLVLVYPRWATDQFVGTWKLNIAKSEFLSALLAALGYKALLRRMNLEP